VKHDLKGVLKYNGRNFNPPTSPICDGTSHHLALCLSSCCLYLCTCLSLLVPCFFLSLSLLRVFFRALLFVYHYLFLVRYHTFFTSTILFTSTTSINSNSSITFFLNYSMYSNHFFFFLVLLPIVNLFLVIYFNSINLSNLYSRQQIQFTFINLPIHTDIQNCENSYQKRFHFSHTDHQFVKVNLI
jgi:hypothetical protein